MISGPMMIHPDPIHDAQFYEGVPLRRLIAFLIDATLITIIGFVVMAVLTVLTLGFALPLFGIVLTMIGFGYRWLTISSTSATPGMSFLGIELRNAQGLHLTPVEAAVHTGIFLFLMLSVIGWIATVVAILGTERRQGLPDLFLGTVAINRPVE